MISPAYTLIQGIIWFTSAWHGEKIWLSFSFRNKSGQPTQIIQDKCSTGALKHLASYPYESH